MSEVLIFDVNEEPKSEFEKDLKNFIIEKNFKKVKVDEDGELILISVDEHGNEFPWRSIEFVEGSETRVEWEEFQYRYDKGEI